MHREIKGGKSKIKIKFHFNLKNNGIIFLKCTFTK